MQTSRRHYEMKGWGSFNNELLNHHRSGGNGAGNGGASTSGSAARGDDGGVRGPTTAPTREVPQQQHAHTHARPHAHAAGPEQQQDPGGVQPDVIARFLAEQHSTGGSSSGGGGSRGGGAVVPAPLSSTTACKQRGGGGSTTTAATGLHPRWRVRLAKLVRRLLITSAAAGLVAGGVVLGRHMHAVHVAALDDRDTLQRRVEELSKQLERAAARAAAAESAHAFQQQALDAATARGAVLARETAEVGRLNRALQLRLEKAEALAEQAESKLAAVTERAERADARASALASALATARAASTAAAAANSSSAAARS